MNFLQQVHERRKNLAEVLQDEDNGIRGMVEELYPDRAHFIYELLQNAEDANATEASFDLHDDQLVFRHNGQPFSEDDVWGITNIGKSTKRDQDEKIGRFGVGFKSVFAYSETPRILSPTYSFRISGLVLPEEITSAPELNSCTRFEFPFNNPKKDRTSAYDEIKTGLDDLAETTLLFLTNLALINWQIGETGTGGLLKAQHPDNHLEVLKQVDDKITESYHFLKFVTPVEGLARQNVAVAFELDFLPDIKQFEPTQPIAKQLRITPASPGRVAVFFPAEKESSGLRFHLHAPFVSELSRASVKEAPANDPLFDQLAELTAASLHTIRDLGLLTREFLAVLPNQNDGITTHYECVRQAVIEKMNREPLTPKHGGYGHAPATQMLQARATLKNILTDADLAFFHGSEKHWAVSATQRNNEVDRFLQQLDIREWDISEFLDKIDDSGEHHIDGDGFHNWLSRKPMEWHQRLYAALWELDSQGTLIVKNKPIVRLASGKYSVGRECFFPDDTQSDSDIMPRVDARIYTAEKNKKQQEDAKRFLEKIGVRAIGEHEEIEAILKQRYTDEAGPSDEGIYCADLKRFVALVESDPRSVTLFKPYCVVDVQNGWAKAENVFLDRPISETGLLSYYEALGGDARRVALSDAYQNCGIPPEKLAKFLSAIGVQTKLEIEEVLCKHNPQWSHLSGVPGNQTHNCIDRDFTIEHLDSVLQASVLELSRLIWHTMEHSLGDHLKATYQKNRSSGARYADSQLVYILREREWIPQKGRPFVRPSEASRDLLPDGFSFDPGWDWLKAIKFGEEIAKNSEEERQKSAVAQELGFKDEDSLRDAKEFAAFPPEERKRILDENREPKRSDLPEHESSNPDRRAQRVGAMAADAPERRTEVRDRSISVGVDAIKKEAGQYLTQQYTNPDGKMICQACRGPLPFKLEDGTDYFERVQFLKELRNYHYQNYLALCPNHAAMFQYANGSCNELRNMVFETSSDELELLLAHQITRVCFTKIHLSDLRAVVEAEGRQRYSEQEKEDGCEDGDEK